MLFVSDAYHKQNTHCRHLVKTVSTTTHSTLTNSSTTQIPLKKYTPIRKTFETDTVQPSESTTDNNGAVSELILSGQSWDTDPLIVPIVSQLAKDDEARWLTLVLEADSKKTISWLKSYGLNSHKIQLLHPHDKKQLLELTKKALASGTSHTVISWLNDLDNGSLIELESAAKNGQCRGVAIRSRNAA